MQPRLTLGVEDFARALAFYRDGLGLPVETLLNPSVPVSYTARSIQTTPCGR